MTAAHCIKSNTNQTIHVGTFNFSLPRSKLDGIDVDIRGVKIHPLYNYKSSYFDVAIITSDKINFTIGIQPICLPESSSTDVHKYDQYSVLLLGWGASNLNGNASKTLKKVSQTIFPNEYCNQTHIREGEVMKDIHNAAPDLFLNHLICAGTDIQSQGACKGDSGGPLQLFDFKNLRYQQVGIVHGSVHNCGQSSFPGIYVRLDDPAIFDFLKSGTNESTIDSREPHLHLFLFPYERNLGVFNWRTNELCYAEIFSYFDPTSVVVLNGTLMFSTFDSNDRIDRTFAKYLKESKTWEKTDPLGRYYEGGTIVPDKGWVMFRSDIEEEREYIKILDSPDGKWKDGPKLPFSGEIERDCILQLNDTTTFILKNRDEGFEHLIMTFDWSTNKYTEHEPRLPYGFAKKSSCALIKDENGQQLVAIVYNRKHYEMQMEIWNPVDDSIVSEEIPVSNFHYLSPALVAINGGRGLLLYPGYHNLFEESHGKSAVWEYNLASKSWRDTGIGFETKKTPMVFSLDSFAIEDFNCITQ